MKVNKLVLLILVFALAVSFSLVGCSSAPPADKPVPGVPAPGVTPPAPVEPEPAPEPGDAPYEFDEVFVTNVTPKLQALVDEGKLTADRMAEVIAKIKTGEYQKSFVQKILSGDEK